MHLSLFLGWREVRCLLAQSTHLYPSSPVNSFKAMQTRPIRIASPATVTAVKWRNLLKDTERLPATSVPFLISASA